MRVVDLIFTMMDIYINSKLNPLIKFISNLAAAASAAAAEAHNLKISSNEKYLK